MKNKIRLRAAIFFVALFFSISLFSQANNPSGDYAVDSLWFEYAHTSSIQISLNGAPFTEYTGGFWMYPRPEDVNTWESGQFSKSPFAPWQYTSIDTTQLRGNTKKLNVVKIIDTSGHQLIYSYQLGVQGISSIPRVEIYVDSMDAFGAEGFYGPGQGLQRNFPRSEWVWNYRLDGDDVAIGSIPRTRIEKKAYLIVVENGSILFQQNCGVRISANSSANQYNKTLAVVARNEYGQNRFPGALYGTTTPQKWLKFRSGGSGQLSNFGANEIVKLGMEGLHIGEGPVRPVRVYLNGSYWTLAFCQEKVDEYTAERLFGFNRDSSTISGLAQIVPVTQQQVSGMLANGVDTSLAVFVTIKGISYASRVADHGNVSQFEQVVQMILDTLVDSVITNAGFPVDFSLKSGYSSKFLDSVVNMRSMYRYLCTVHFWQLQDAISNNVSFVLSPGTKLELMARDFDYSMNGDTSLLMSMFETHGKASLGFILAKVIREHPEDFILTYQDLINTTYKSDVLSRHAERIINPVRLFYPETYISWGGYPNGGSDTSFQSMQCTHFSNYCNNRQVAAVSELAGYFMPEKGWSSADQHEVCVVIDPDYRALGFKVLVNSLETDSSWCGAYYPLPALKINAVVPDGYELVWKEFPDSTDLFRPRVDSFTTITPILTAKTTAITETEEDLVSIVPNPSRGNFVIKNKKPNESCVVLNALGVVILETTDSNIYLNAESGPYFIKLKNKVYKLIIQ